MGPDRRPSDRLFVALAAVVTGARRSDARGDQPCAPSPSRRWWCWCSLSLAGFALFAHDDPRTYSPPTSSGGTSDVITVAESPLCLGLLSLAAVAGWYMATPLTRGGPAGARDST